jgi:hypothetical protein
MTGYSRSGRIAGYALLAVALGSALVPLLPFAEALPVWKHHLVHALILALASTSGILLAHIGSRTAAEPSEAGPGFWAVLCVLAPAVSMFLMWPTTYDWVEHYPLAHGAEHFCFVGLGFLAGFGGERYVRGVGWVSAAATVLTAIAAAAGFGVVAER